MSSLSVLAAITAALFSSSRAETIQCNSQFDLNKQCGPCTKAGLCNLQCLTLEDICLETLFKCPSTDACQVDCDANYACLDAIVDAVTSPQLTVNCLALSGCETSQINAGQDTDVVVNCGGTENTCKDLVINANFANDVTVNCDGFKSCIGTTIYATNANKVTVNCNNADSTVCSSLALTCGAGDCAIDCSGGTNKCPSIQVTTANAHSFTCIGDAADCYYAPPNYALPSLPPTSAPSLNPTTSPVPVPSVSPTIQPSLSPTSSPVTVTPTTSPTKVPTRATTKSPSANPSAAPTKPPTSNPTQTTSGPTQSPSVTGATPNPSLSPTRSTGSPSKTPTKSPTSNPTGQPTRSPTSNPITTTTTTTTTTTATSSTTAVPVSSSTSRQPITTVSSSEPPVTTSSTTTSSASPVTTLPTIATIPDIPRAPSGSPSVSPTMEPTTTASPTTAEPTADQTDHEICCGCTSSTMGVKGCKRDTQCEDKICGIDSYCCESQWDNTCAYYASDQCDKTKQIPETTAMRVEEAPSNLDLVWKFALVVFAIMVLIVSCCIILLRIHRMCQTCKHRKMKKEKSLSGRKLKRRQSKKSKKNKNGEKDIYPVSSPQATSTFHIAQIKAANNTLITKKRVDEESTTMTQFDDEDTHPMERGYTEPAMFNAAQKAFIRRYYSMNPLSVNSNPSRISSFNGAEPPQQQQLINSNSNTRQQVQYFGAGGGIEVSNTNSAMNIVNGVVMPTGMELEFGSDYQKEDRFIIDNIMTEQQQEDEDSLSMSDDTQALAHRRVKTLSSKKSAVGVQPALQFGAKIRKHDTVQTNSRHSTETSVADEETDHDDIEQDGDEREQVINIVADSRVDRMDGARDGLPSMKKAMGVQLVHTDDDDRADDAMDGARLIRDEDERVRDGDAKVKQEDSEDTDEEVSVSDDPISEIMKGLKRMQSVKHHSI